jgi:hypothetical protein
MMTFNSATTMVNDVEWAKCTGIGRIFNRSYNDKTYF